MEHFGQQGYIFLWTPGLLLLFTLINLFCLRRLNADIYLIESMPGQLPQFVKQSGFRSLYRNVAVVLRRSWYALVYTSAIFFKVTLKIENFKFSNIAGTIYLVVIYIAGLICLAYVANFVIQH